MFASTNVSENIDKVANHFLAENSFESFDIRKSIQDILGESKVTYIYPKNLFDENLEEAIFYVFHDKFISEVRRDMDKYQIKTYPLNIVELNYQRPEYVEYGVVKLELHLDNGKVFVFDSAVDNNVHWKKSFTAIIQEIYYQFIK